MNVLISTPFKQYEKVEFPMGAMVEIQNLRVTMYNDLITLNSISTTLTKTISNGDERYHENVHDSNTNKQKDGQTLWICDDTPKNIIVQCTVDLV